MHAVQTMNKLGNRTNYNLF